MRIYGKWLFVFLIAAALSCSFASAESTCGHDLKEIILKEANCAEKGIMMQHCDLCGYRTYVAVEPLHTYHETADATVPATCDEPGGMVWYCTLCNQNQDPEADGVYCEVIPAAHSYADEVRYIDATCEEDARFVRVCTACGEYDVLQTDEDSKAVGHDWQYCHTEATCTEAEKYLIICTNCEKIRWEAKDVLSQPLGHKKTENFEVITPADCENAARIAWKCAVCGERVEEYEGEAPGHTIDVIVKEEATCYQTGLADHICSVCGKTVEENALIPIAEACSAYETVIAPSTCTENGIMEYHCKWCDAHLYFGTIPFGHEEGDVEVIVPASCTENGVGQVHCMVCGELLKELSLPCTGHVYTKAPVLETESCTDASVAVLTCDVCGDKEICAVDAYQQKPVHQRAYRYTAPDCECCGTLEVYCAACDEVLLTLSVEEDKALGHVYDGAMTVIEAPSCEKNGLEAWVCSRCNAQHDVSVIQALDHQIEMQITAPATCYDSGLAKRVCTVCDMIIEDHIVLDMLADCEKMQEVLIAPSCTQDGLCQYVCKWCDRLMGYEILPSGHIAGDAQTLVEATCTQEGRVQVCCLYCNEPLDEYEVPCAEHQYPAEASYTKGATCTEDAKLIYCCMNCNADGSKHDAGVKTEVVGEQIGHVWQEETAYLPSDCMRPGRTVKICSVCKEAEVVSYDRSDPAKGHQLEYHLIQPTCTQPMLVSAVCTLCGYEIECEPAEKMDGIMTDALGHVLPDEWTIEVDPTCQTVGMRTKACTVCGETVEQEEIACVPCKERVECVLQEANCLTGANQITLMTCEWCGEIVRVDVTEWTHVFGEETSVVVLNAACDTEGILLNVCKVCGHEEKLSIAPVGHMASDPVIVPANCESCEQVVIVCTVCNEILNVEAEIGEALGHDYAVYDPVIDGNVCIYCRDVQID